MPEGENNQGTIPNTSTPEPIGFDQWSAHIPSEIKEGGYWANVKDQPLSTVLKNYGHAQERLGKAIVIPGKEDKDGLASMWNKLGRPEKADGYKYDLPKHENVKWDADTFKGFAEVAHGLGVTNDQLSGIIGWFTKDVLDKNGKLQDEYKTAVSNNEAALKKEYGSNYDGNLALARRAAETYFGGEAGKAYIENNMANPEVIKGMVKLGTQLAEDGVFGKNPAELEGVISREKAQAKINEIMSNRSHAYWGNPSDSMTQAALKEMENLHKIAFPE